LKKFSVERDRSEKSAEIDKWQLVQPTFKWKTFSSTLLQTTACSNAIRRLLIFE
jgi:hypothetical protein